MLKARIRTSTAPWRSQIYLNPKVFSFNFPAWSEAINKASMPLRGNVYRTDEIARPRLRRWQVDNEETIGVWPRPDFLKRHSACTLRKVLGKGKAQLAGRSVRAEDNDSQSARYSTTTHTSWY